MNKRLISACIFVVYCAILIKVMVFKDIPTIKIGQLMLNFGGADVGHAPNFVPFKTILPYLFGYKGLIIAGINLVGNIALLVPIGFLAPFMHRNMTWKKSLVLGIVSGLAIEIMQVVLHVGIFDIDDVILNALGVMIGYWAFLLFAKWMREGSYKKVITAAVLIVIAPAAIFYAVVYPHDQPVNPAVGIGSDPCGGTGGIGKIVSLDNDTFTIDRGDGKSQMVTLSDQATITTSSGSGSKSDLKAGDRVTLVGGPNPDGSFTADAVFVCGMPASEAGLMQ